jgi:6-phosphogluconolactonase
MSHRPIANLLVGTYTEQLPHVSGKALGILGASFDGTTVAPVTVAAKVRNPSWLTTTADGRHLYAVVETVEFEGRPGGGVAAYTRDPGTGELAALNTASSGGVEPAHLALDPSERFLLVANYRTGSVTVFALESDGSLGAVTSHVQHEGSSVHPVRQSGPHAHQIAFDRATGDLIVPDLGLDALIVYRLDDEGGLVERSRFSTQPGAGPRHVAFHPAGRHVLLLNELDNTLVVLRREGESFVVADTVSTLPADFTGHSQGAAIRVSASGRWVFTSNRGPDNIAMFSFDEETERVSLAHVEPTLGHEPRDIILTPDGSHLLVANQDSDTIVTFEVDEESPRLRQVSVAEVPTPVCLHFAAGEA